ncbi:hypothetical protein ACQ4PT_050009 [Festuca glaucescens]
MCSSSACGGPAEASSSADSGAEQNDESPELVALEFGCPGDGNVGVHVSCCRCCRFGSDGEEQRMIAWGYLIGHVLLNKKTTIPYSFKVITSLPPHEGPNLSFHALDEQFDLLGKVLNTWDNMVGVEHLEEDSDGKARLKARHSAG